MSPPTTENNKRKRGDGSDDDEQQSSTNNSTKSKKLSPTLNTSSSSVQRTTLLLEENNVSMSDTTNQKFIKLDPAQYDTWTKEEVCSLLLTKKAKGGAGLSSEYVKPLYDAGFNGTSLDNIIKYLLELPSFSRREASYVIDEAMKNFPDISRDVLTSVVNWAIDLLKTRLYHLWSAEHAKEQLALPILNGGAGLSEEEMLPFNNSIKQIIQLDALEGLGEEQTITKIKNFISKKQITVIEIFKNSRDITPNMLKEARVDPSYDYLRNLLDPCKMNQLKTMIGSNISLPKLGSLGTDYLPKELDPNLPYILTRQRFDLLQKVVMRVDSGFVLSGPFGVSKSYAMYLLAAYAIVNSIPLLYVPLCGAWVFKYKEGGKRLANDYIRSLIFYWNSDILSDNDIYSIKNTDDFINYFSKTIGNNQTVLNLFDEHNELFRSNDEDKSPAKEDYFEPFTSWTRLTTGAKTITIYCGSAHSAFEDNLPGGTHTKIVRIVPPSEEEFKQLITDFGLDSNLVEKISHVTGRIPRELKALSVFIVEKGAKEITDTILNEFIQVLMNIYNQRLHKLVQYLEKNKKKQDFLNTLEELFSLGLHKGRPIGVIGAAYDQGLMYKSASEQLYIINEPAKRTLFNYYCTEFSSTVTVISKNITSSERGAQFQRYLIAKEFNSNSKHRAIYSIITPSSDLKKQIVLDYSVNVHMNFDLQRGLFSLSHKKFLSNTTVLFVPESESFPAFDYTIISYQNKVINIFLKQTTISSIDSHYLKDNNTTDIDNLTKRVYIVNNDGATRKKNPTNYLNEMLFSLLELMIYGVVGDFGINVETKEKEQVKQRKHNVIEMAFNSGQFNSTIQIDDMIITWYYIYESGTSLNEQSVTKVKETGVLYRNKEEIEDVMKIFIEDEDRL